MVERQGSMAVGWLVLNAVTWHLAIVSSIASKRHVEASPFGWFFFPGCLILAATLVVLAVTTRLMRGHLVLLLLAAAVVQVAYASLYRAVRDTKGIDSPGWLIDVSAILVIGFGAFLGYRIGNWRLQRSHEMVH